MGRLIDADKTIGHIKTRLLETALNNCDVVCDASYLYTDCADNRIETWVDEMPTVDAVEVVRCKECENWGTRARTIDNDGNTMSCDCLALDRMTKADFYCSWGERKDEVTECTTHT